MVLKEFVALNLPENVKFILINNYQIENETYTLDMVNQIKSPRISSNYTKWNAIIEENLKIV